MGTWERILNRVHGINCTKMVCDYSEFPSEMWEEILSHIDNVKDLKNVSCVCQMFNSVIKNKLWNAPKFKSGISPEDFLKLKHLPIRKLYTGDFGKLNDEKGEELTERWMQVISQFNQLTCLKLGWNIDLTYSYIGKLTTLTNLKSLTFEKLYAGISKAIFQLIYLPLESLCIQDQIFRKDIEPILKFVREIPTIKKLEIKTDDQGCVYLSKLSQLEVLIVNESTLTIEGVKQLCKLQSLKKLKLYKCWYPSYQTRHNIDVLKAANPNLQLDIDLIEIKYDDISAGHNQTCLVV